MSWALKRNQVLRGLVYIETVYKQELVRGAMNGRSPWADVLVLVLPRGPELGRSFDFPKPLMSLL